MEPEGTPHSFTVALQRLNDKCIVKCIGDLVGGGCGVLQKQVSDLLPHSKLIVLDFNHLEFIDSMGLGTLVRLHISCKEAGCRLHLDNVGKRIKELLSLTNLLHLFA
jgi:anti-sigma B factor antagonist